MPSRRRPAKASAILFALLFAAMTLPGAAPAPGSNRVWITDVFPVSPENLARVEQGSVPIEDGRIARVERSGMEKRHARVYRQIREANPRCAVRL